MPKSNAAMNHDDSDTGRTTACRPVVSDCNIRRASCRARIAYIFAVTAIVLVLPFVEMGRLKAGLYIAAIVLILAFPRSIPE